MSFQDLASPGGLRGVSLFSIFLKSFSLSLVSSHCTYFSLVRERWRTLGRRALTPPERSLLRRASESRGAPGGGLALAVAST